MKRDCITAKKRGITLVETVISLLIFGIAIGSVIGAFVVSRTSAARIKRRAVALNLARAKIEAIKGLAYSETPNQAGTENVVLDEGAGPAGNTLTGQRTTAITDVYGNSDMYRVTVTVVWTELSGTLQEGLITLISRH